MTTPVPVQKNAETVGSIGGDEFAELQQNEEMVRTNKYVITTPKHTMRCDEHDAKRALLPQVNDLWTTQAPQQVYARLKSGG